ncbi:MAG: 2Fe-2S iron-sulfur cluster binding domain-containing protein [Bacteriovorax sp.]|nr:2Fe-2S iron-sulfur cluster binding domain-containing protein [Bacteriovorax sp.]
MKKIILSPSHTTIEIEDNETVLSGLERHGFVLPNNCRAGACGECKVKVLDGNFDQGFILDMALKAEERACGMGLMCMAKVTSESLTIDFQKDNVLSKLPTPKENLPYVVTEKLMMTETIVKLRLKPLKDTLRFWPGQYITLGSPEHKIPLRAYSLANIPTQEGELVLYITKVNRGVTSNYIHQELNCGDTLTLNGPYGTFIGDPRLELPVLCIANGSGLAPIMSLATAALMRGGFKYPAHIIFSARTSQDIFDLGHFKFLEKKYRNFKFIPTLTGETNPAFKAGRVTTLLPTLYPDLAYYAIYIAGSSEFVRDVKALALSLGAKEENIYLESFLSQDLPLLPDQ